MTLQVSVLHLVLCFFSFLFCVLSGGRNTQIIYLVTKSIKNTAASPSSQCVTAVSAQYYHQSKVLKVLYVLLCRMV